MSMAANLDRDYMNATFVSDANTQNCIVNISVLFLVLDSTCITYNLCPPPPTLAHTLYTL